MTHLTESRDALAKALWVLQATDESLSSEWADRAWDDMGGSEPSEERVDAELLADALIGSGVVIDAATLADDDALMRHMAQLWLVHQNDYHGQDLTPHTKLAVRVTRALVAALTEGSRS